MFVSVGVAERVRRGQHPLAQARLEVFPAAVAGDPPPESLDQCRWTAGLHRTKLRRHLREHLVRIVEHPVEGRLVEAKTRGNEDQALRTPSLRPITSAKESGEAGDEQSTDTAVCAQHRPSVLDDRFNPIAGLAL